MVPDTFDVVIVGSGFGGSLLALVLDRLGLRTAIIDSVKHPRFAIGESSTPIAGMVLRELAEEYGLLRLQPLAKYHSAAQAYPNIVMGKKRGFSYFAHAAGRDFETDSAHSNELLVAASRDDEHSDSHWLRADFDAFVASEARAAGIPLLEEGELADIDKNGSSWQLGGTLQGEAFQLQSKFIIDASGASRVLLRRLGIGDCTHRLNTCSAAAFAHFEGVPRWEDTLAKRAFDVTDYPFACDDAALHHVLEEGWMWWLRFRNDITSVGLVLRQPSDADGQRLTQADWDCIMRKYSSLDESLKSTRAIAPTQALTFTKRLQRLASQAAGSNWAALPNTVGFIDPLHSTGIAQTLCAIRRLAHIFATAWESERLQVLLGRYDRSVQAELKLIDLLVDGCYRSLPDFRLFTVYSMLYFAAAVTDEHRHSEGNTNPLDAFLCAEDTHFAGMVGKAHRKLTDIRSGGMSRSTVDEFTDDVRRWIEPYNIAGLCDPSLNNMYRYTASPT